MSFANEIVKNAEKKANAIVEKAKGEAKEEVDKLKSSLEEELKKSLEEYKKSLEERRKEVLASARLEAKRLVESAKEDKVREAIEKAIEELKAYRKTKAYKAWVEKKIKEALKELGIKESEAIIHVAKGDKKLIKTKAKVKEDLEDIAGIIVERKDGKVRVNYSFSQLLERNMDEVKRLVISRLK